VLALSFSQNGQKMASAAADGTARTWTVPLNPLPAEALARIGSAASHAKAAVAPQRPRRILVFWRADAILHKAGVAAINHALEVMSKSTGAYEADFSREFDVFDPALLSHYDALVLNSTAHLVMPENAKKAYLDYVKGGGGVVGFHAAIDTFLYWPEGAKVVGATFGDHPWGPNGTWGVKLEEPNHPLLRAFGGQNFKIKDEFYVMGEPFTRADRRVLMSVDLSDQASAAVNLSANPARSKDHDFALAWVKHYGAGRVFYADFGHIAEPFERQEIDQFYLDGIQYVLGDLKVDDAPKGP
jgi:type 1 glutamine amidotransferase